MTGGDEGAHRMSGKNDHVVREKEGKEKNEDEKRKKESWMKGGFNSSSLEGEKKEVL